MKKCNFFLSNNPDFDAVTNESALSQAIRQGPLDFSEYVRLATKAKFYSDMPWDLLLFVAVFVVLKYYWELPAYGAVLTCGVMLLTVNLLMVFMTAMLLAKRINKNRQQFNEEVRRCVSTESLILSDVRITLKGVFSVLWMNWMCGCYSTFATMKTVLTTETYVLMPREKEAIFVVGSTKLDLPGIVHAHNSAQAILLLTQGLREQKDAYFQNSI